MIADLGALFAPALLAAIVAIVILAGLAHGTVGFGFPLVSTPLVALLVDIRTAVLVTVLPNIAVNIISILRGGNWRDSIGRHWPLAAWVVVGTLIGTRLLLGLPAQPLELLLAAMIAVFLLQDRLKLLDWSWVRRHPKASACLFGIAAGILAGSVNVALPPLVIYLMTLDLPPVALTQTLNLCFIAGKIVQASVLGVSDDASRRLLLASLPLVFVAVGAVYAGMRVQAGIGVEQYKRLLRRSLAAIAVLLVLQAGWALLRG